MVRCRRAARLSASVGPTKKTTTQITQSRRNRIGLLRASGLFAADRGRVSQQRALSDGAAVVSGSFDQRGPVAARAVGEAHVLNRSPGHVDSDDAGSAVGPLRTAARPWRAVWTGRAPSTVGLFRHLRHLSLTHGGGSNHRARLAPRGTVTESDRGRRWRARAATRVIQHAVPPSRGRSWGLTPRTGSRGTLAVNGR